MDPVFFPKDCWFHGLWTPTAFSRSKKKHPLQVALLLPSLGPCAFNVAEALTLARRLCTPWKFNSSPLKINHQERKGSSSKQPIFRGELLNLGGCRCLCFFFRGVDFSLVGFVVVLNVLMLTCGMYVGDCFWWEYDKLASWKFVCQTCSKHQTSKIVQRTGVWSLNQKVDRLLVLFLLMSRRDWYDGGDLKEQLPPGMPCFECLHFTVYIYIHIFSFWMNFEGC